jgi:hypothetical protein
MPRDGITRPKLLLVEGDDEVYFFQAMISQLGIDDVDIRPVKGKTKFSKRLGAWIKGPGHEILTSLGLVMDADNDPDGAFRSLCGALENVGLPVPSAPLQPVTDHSLRVSVMILPNSKEAGMLEDLCLASVADDPAMDCVDDYIHCLENKIDEEEFPRNPAKARVRAFLAAMGWIEEGYFDCIQEHIKLNPPENPVVESTEVFLASRSKPRLDLGIAAKAGYLPLNHPVFSHVRQFLVDL